MTLYEELELTPECSIDDIKQQYRTLAKKHHPDLGGDEEVFKRIKLAYEVLSDPVRRKHYDETKSTWQAPSIKTEAISTLANIFFSIIPNFNCNHDNLIDRMKLETNTMKNQAEADSILCDVYISNLEVVKQKLQLKNPNEENIILSFVERQLETRHQDKKTFAHRIELTTEMLIILENYNYGFLELVNPVMESTSEEPNQF